MRSLLVPGKQVSLPRTSGFEDASIIDSPRESNLADPTLEPLMEALSLGSSADPKGAHTRMLL